jgi:acyl-coenzyme A synthetase/AMP-(fatty) acid ligase
MDPERTQRAFFEADGRRWYRTGDLAEPHPEHGFLFRGRLDSQVKLRGYRVELGEVEAALRKAAGTDLVAAVPFDEAGTASWRSLAAFLCGAPCAEDELRTRLRTLLPEYMMPNRIRFLDAMPKNVNDKVDYLALRRMAAEDA